MKSNNKDLIKLSKSLKKFVIGFEGNVSKKHENGIIIKSSGKSLKNIKKNNFTFVSSNNCWSGNKPSMEYKLHKWIINKFNVNYVAHTHPTNTLKILCTDNYNDFANKRLFPDQVVFNGSKSCVIDYFNPGDDLFNGLINGVENFIKKNNFLPKVILLKNHGIITFGNKIEECIMATEMCEKSAKIFLTNEGKKVFLSEPQVHKLINDENEIYRIKKL